LHWLCPPIGSRRVLMSKLSVGIIEKPAAF
jgi:hypothetical protein